MPCSEMELIMLVQFLVVKQIYIFHSKPPLLPRKRRCATTYSTDSNQETWDELGSLDSPTAHVWHSCSPGCQISSYHCHLNQVWRHFSSLNTDPPLKTACHIVSAMSLAFVFMSILSFTCNYSLSPLPSSPSLIFLPNPFLCALVLDATYHSHFPFDKLADASARGKKGKNKSLRFPHWKVQVNLPNTSYPQTLLLKAGPSLKMLHPEEKHTTQLL